MSYGIFQTATGTLQKVTTDGSGDETTTDFTVSLDPVIGRRTYHDKDGTLVKGYETIISPNSNIDLSHDRWNLVYGGRTFRVEGFEPIIKIGTTDVLHYEVTLR
nr:hypothetical protein 4 [bacterium]